QTAAEERAIGVEILGPHPFAGIEVHALGSRGACSGRWRHSHAVRVARRCFADVSPAFRGCSAVPFLTDGEGCPCLRPRLRVKASVVDSARLRCLQFTDENACKGTEAEPFGD